MYKTNLLYIKLIDSRISILQTQRLLAAVFPYLLPENMTDWGEQVEVNTERELKTAAAEHRPPSVIVHSNGPADPNATWDYMDVRARGRDRYRAYGTPEELAVFPRNDDGIILFEDAQIKNLPRTVPARLAAISHVSQYRRIHRISGGTVGYGSAWNQVYAALEDEHREDILEKVSVFLLYDLVHT